MMRFGDPFNNKIHYTRRPGAYAIIQVKGKILLTFQENENQLPGGGIDKNENSFDAAIRELKEETSIVNVELIEEIKEEITYKLPDNLLGIIWKGKFKGQTQKWYVMRFLGTDNEINLKTNHPEFLD